MSNSEPVSIYDLFNGNRSLSDFFWQYVDIKNVDQCWEWLGNRKIRGYGHFGLGDRFFRAHRLALIFSGYHLSDDQVVLHLCDNRSCCNPKHLKIGTQQENLIDMRRKGRGVDPPIMKGEKNPQAVLSTEQIIFIRNSTLKGIELAKQFGVAKTTISSIKNRKIWKHV